MSSSSAPCYRIVITANTGWYLYNFRLALLNKLRANSQYELTLVCPNDTYSNHLIQHGFNVVSWNLKRSSLNPFGELRSLLSLYTILRSLKPHLVHNFTIKSCIYSTICAKLLSIPVVINGITGLGHTFVSRRRRTYLIRLFVRVLYKKIILARRSTSIFQNRDDISLLNASNLDSSRAQLIRGSGVDTNYFKPSISLLDTYKSPTVLFPSRLIKEKGISDLISSCNTLWDKNLNFDLLIAGDLDHGNRSCLDELTYNSLSTNPRIRLLGHVDDMPSLYEQATIVALPSWREGLSRSLIEAAAMQRPVITTDVPGCRDVVNHGETGLLVPPFSPSSLSLAIELLLLNPSLSEKFGINARKIVNKYFTVSRINDETLNVYRTRLCNL